ncbi:ETC complex I subunit [Candidatus Liberibacter africanus]|uniref:Oxidoreductase protein n=1 Tax=Candidatus Liberibacter africanus PTSAPSY TaxID=1277257 RepID=A0A0G3I9M9_LIBAF|nr:NADH dehydrogenase ubiquinone Fe-S protein 4 [Candidatus Liberibacter africanus]AKK20487.1 oxidoreductase protein [Candidatus Liberibacter africanus PTSAPSY]QTP64203.1 ETC complex I subunit [Candidatus Liberibacter africanus]
MIAKIYSKSKSSTQSGRRGRIGEWVLEFEKSSPPYIEPLLGYTSSKDTLQQVKIFFPSLETAEKYAKDRFIQYYVIPLHKETQKKLSYQKNFSYDRLEPWTH